MVFDLGTIQNRVDHDPTQQISDDPSSVIGKSVGDLAETILGGLPKLVLSELGQILSNPGQLIQDILDFPQLIGLGSLQDWIGQIPVIGPLIEAIIGEAGDLLDLSNFFGNIETFFGGISFADGSFDPEDAIRIFISTALLPAELLAPLVGGFLPLAIIPQIPGAIVGGFQELIDVIGNALGYTNHSGQSLPGIGFLLSALRQDVDAAQEMSTNAWQQAQQLGATVIQLVEDEAEQVILSPLQFGQQFLTSIGNWLGLTHQSNSPTNPAVTALAGRQAALEAVVLNGSSTTGFNDHLNRATLGSDYTVLGAHSPVMQYDGGDDGYLIGGDNICGVHLTASALPMVTDRNRFQWSLRGFDVFGHTGRHRVLICANTGFTNYLAVEVYRTGFAERVRIYSVTSGTWSSTGTQQTNWTPPKKLKEWDTFDIAYDPVTNTFFLYFNSNPADFWTDSTNIIGHGTGHREVGLVLNMDDNSGTVGLGVDDLSVWDYPVTT